MMTSSHEAEARIVLEALKAGLPGKGTGTLAPDMASVRYSVDSKPPISVILVKGTIIAKTEGLSTSQGGFLFNEAAETRLVRHSEAVAHRA